MPQKEKKAIAAIALTCLQFFGGTLFHHVPPVRTIIPHCCCVYVSRDEIPKASSQFHCCWHEELQQKSAKVTYKNPIKHSHLTVGSTKRSPDLIVIDIRYSCLCNCQGSPRPYRWVVAIPFGESDHWTGSMDASRFSVEIRLDSWPEVRRCQVYRLGRLTVTESSSRPSWHVAKKAARSL